MRDEARRESPRPCCLCSGAAAGPGAAARPSALPAARRHRRVRGKTSEGRRPGAAGARLQALPAGEARPCPPPAARTSPGPHRSPSAGQPAGGRGGADAAAFPFRRVRAAAAPAAGPERWPEPRRAAMAPRRRRGLAAAGSLLPLLCALLRVAADTSTGRVGLGAGGGPGPGGSAGRRGRRCRSWARGTGEPGAGLCAVSDRGRAGRLRGQRPPGSSPVAAAGRSLLPGRSFPPSLVGPRRAALRWRSVVPGWAQVCGRNRWRLLCLGRLGTGRRGQPSSPCVLWSISLPEELPLVPVGHGRGSLSLPAPTSEPGPEGKGTTGEGSPRQSCPGRCALPLLLKDSLFWSDRRST